MPKRSELGEMIEIIPPKVYLLAVNKEHTKAVLRFDNLIKQMGDSLGNTLTRVLLCHIPGYAIQAFKMLVDGSNVGKFDGINGFIENETGLEGNLTAIRLKIHEDEMEGYDPENSRAENLVISYKSAEKADFADKKVITAGDLTVPKGVEILNKDLIILTKGNNTVGSVDLELKYGYNTYFSSSREQSKVHEDDKNFITINSIYSPVIKAHYNVSEGNNRLLENLTMTIETTGAITPIQAFVTACRLVSTYTDLMSSVESIFPMSLSTGNSHEINVNTTGNGVSLPEELLKVIDGSNDRPIEELGLSSIVYNYLKLKDVKKVSDIAEKHITYDEDFIDKLINNKSGVYTSVNGQEININKDTLVSELQSINFTNIGIETD